MKDLYLDNVLINTDTVEAIDAHVKELQKYWSISLLFNTKEVVILESC